MKYFLLLPVLIFLILGTYLYFYLGVGKKPELLGIHRQPFTIIAQSHVGPFHQIGKAIENVERFFATKNLSCPHPVGYYLDDPSTTDHDRLRSYGGCLVEGNSIDIQLEGDFEVIDLAPREYLKISFSGSPAISPYKVYPLASHWLQAQKRTADKGVIEVYSTITGEQESSTLYYFPLTP